MCFIQTLSNDSLTFNKGHQMLKLIKKIKRSSRTSSMGFIQTLVIACTTSWDTGTQLIIKDSIRITPIKLPGAINLTFKNKLYTIQPNLYNIYFYSILVTSYGNCRRKKSYETVLEKLSFKWKVDARQTKRWTLDKSGLENICGLSAGGAKKFNLVVDIFAA